jgi:Tfp pilus assembly PilM family ATPase
VIENGDLRLMKTKVLDLRKKLANGVSPAMATPLEHDSYRVNTAVIPQLVDFLLDKGVKGLFVGGTTGEGVMLDAGERKKLHEATVATVNGRAPVLLHIGAQHTDLAVLRGTAPLVCRTIEAGASSMVKAAADSLQLPYAEAVEHLKGVKSSDDASALYVQQFVETLSRELRTSIEYCSREYDLKIERIYVTGAAAKNELVCQYIADALGCQTFCFNPFVKVKMDKLNNRIADFRSKAPAFVPALGLAVRHLKL